jgi:hypothetical protein
MQPLIDEQIEKLASKAGVKRTAVENFLGTLYAPAGRAGSLRNLYDDAASYKWNSATIEAIRAGVKLAFGG